METIKTEQQQSVGKRFAAIFWNDDISAAHFYKDVGGIPYALAKYFTKSNSRMESIAVGAFYALLVAFVLYKMTPEECKKLESKEPQGLFLTMAALSLYGLNLGLASAARMAALFGPYLIVLLPRMLEYINCPRRRAATIQWLAVAAGLQYVLRLLINNIGGTMPYQFFWAA